MDLHTISSCRQATLGGFSRAAQRGHVILKYSQVANIRGLQQMMQLLDKLWILSHCGLINRRSTLALPHASRYCGEWQEGQDVRLSEVREPERGCSELRRIHCTAVGLAELDLTHSRKSIAWGAKFGFSPPELLEAPGDSSTAHLIPGIRAASGSP